MQPAARQLVERQVARVGRRLFVQILLRHLVIGWTVALAVTAGWMLAEPYVAANATDWLRWAVLGGSLGVCTLLALALTFRRAPSRTAAALSLDELFGLRERVVTALTLPRELETTPAGQALLADAHTRLKELKVSEKFPVQLPWSSAFVPVGAAAVAVVALFYHPVFPVVQGETAVTKVAPEAKKEIAKKLEDLTKKPRLPEKAEERQKSEQLKELEARLDEIAKRPHDNTQQLRDRIKDLTPLEDEIKKLERERTEKARMLQNQLQQKDKMMPNDVPQDGPAKELTKALAEGDVEKAKEELDKLVKKMQNNELTEKEKNDLAKQLENLEKKMERAAEQAQKRDQLNKLAQEGKLDPETLQREMDKLKKDNEKLSDLKKLANKLGQAQKSLQQGEAGKAAQQLGEAAEQMGKMDMDVKELEDLRDQLDKLSSARSALAKACECEGEGRCENDGMPVPHDMLKSSNSAGIGAGRRPDGEQGKYNSYDAKQQSPFSPKGQKVFDGYAPGQAFKKKPGVEMTGEIQQAAQTAPDAIEVQRIPKAAADMAKGYFNNLGGQGGGKDK
jgi:septal ring factor EnvC (AmiA/AmiB activator)